MAITNQERVGKAVDLLRAGLAPYVEREFANAYKDNAQAEARRLLPFQANVALPLCLTPMGAAGLGRPRGPQKTE